MMTPELLSESDLVRLVVIEDAAHISPWSDDVFKRCFEAGYFLWGLKENEKLVGFVVYSLQIGECHILNICVHPDHQGQGLGHCLLVFALGAAKKDGAGIAYLEVRRSNAKALSLYKKMGFVRVGERKGYYPDENGREDALVFAKDLGVT